MAYRPARNHPIVKAGEADAGNRPIGHRGSKRDPSASDVGPMSSIATPASSASLAAVPPATPPPIGSSAARAGQPGAADPSGAAAVASAGSPTITPAHMAVIAEARRGARKITRAATVASISGWTMAFFGAITLVSGLFSLRALLLGIALSAVAWVEIRGAKRLRVFDLRAPLHLAMNQVGLVAAITVYAGWGILEAMSGPGLYADQIAAGGDVAEMLEPYQDLARSLTITIGVAFIVASFFAQGAAALYYRSRRSHIERFLRSTPDWVVAMLRA